MSTLKSSAENLTLNADGSGNDIKFQSNGVEKASIDQDGLLTCVGATMSGDVSLVKASGNSQILVEASATDAYATVRVKNDAKDYSMQVRSDQGDAWTVRDETAGANRIKVDGSTGDTILGGDLVFETAGKGICLGVTTNTDANTLDDYEEGTWTPTVTGSTSGTGTVGNGYYTKIGNVCTISIVVNNAAFPTISGVLRVSLPFTSATNQEYHGGDIYFYPLASWTSGSNFAGLTPRVDSAIAYHTFMVKDVNVNRQSDLSSTNSSISGDTVYCRYSITYVTA